MFTKQQAIQIEEWYRASIQRLGRCSGSFTAVLQRLRGEEALCYQFLVASMPLSDAATYKGELLLTFVKNALEMRQATPWGTKIPTDVFLNDVLFYRVNDENIEDYRGAFAKELFPRVVEKTMRGAALEVNYWCYEKATYESTDDRTVSPLTMMKNGRGRCGEESVFAVSALRSVGIPARQCYVPKWSHCDDNHAWVEVWVDGAWHYMGACEPEPVLDKGWFTYAASKAMLIHSRVFSDLTGQDTVIAKNGRTAELNRLSGYADTGEITVRVLGPDGKPLSGVRVQFQLINYSELAAIAAPTTGADGTVTLQTGRGSLFVFVSHNGSFRSQVIETAEKQEAVLDFSKSEKILQSCDIDFHAPAGKIRPESFPSESDRAEHEKKCGFADAIRNKHRDSFFSQDSAREYASKFPGFEREVSNFLRLAKENASEVIGFLNGPFEPEDKIVLLRQLSRKDFIDCKSTVLTDALTNALPYKPQWDEAIFQPYVLSPRIEYEFLVPCRTRIADFFPNEQHVRFQKNPPAIQQYIEQSIQTCDDLDYAPLSADPAGLLQTGAGSRHSKELLFVAACRTFGIPSRFHPVTGAPEYYQAGGWKRVDGSAARTVCLTLKNSGYPLYYHQNFSIAKLEDGAFRTLEYGGLAIEKEAGLEIEPGLYRVLLTNRQIDGDILARVFYLTVGTEPVTLEISGRQGGVSSRLRNIPLWDASLVGLSGEKTSLFRTAGKAGTILALIEAKKEPTEHLLNEFLALRDRCNAEKGLSILLLVPDEASFAYDLLQKVLAEIPVASAYQYENPAFCQKMFEKVRAGDHRLPLAVVCDGKINAKFHFSNYNVGTAALLLDILKSMSTSE